MQRPWYWLTTAVVATLCVFFAWRWYGASRELAALRAQLERPSHVVSGSTALRSPPRATLVLSDQISPVAAASPEAPAVEQVPDRAAATKRAFKMTPEKLQQIVRIQLATNPDLPRQLGLSLDETREFFELLMSPAQQALARSGDERLTPEQKRERMTAAQQEGELAAASRFGREVVEQYQSYEKSAPARMQVQQLQTDMANHDVPMNAEQRQRLVAELVRIDDEMKRAQAGAPIDAAAQSGRSDRAALIRIQQQTEERIAQAAVSILTAEQMKVLEQRTELMRQFQQIALEGESEPSP